MKRDHLMGYAPATDAAAAADDPLHVFTPSRWSEPARYPCGIPMRLYRDLEPVKDARAEAAFEFELKNHALPDGTMQPTPRQIEEAMRAMLRASDRAKRRAQVKPVLGTDRSELDAAHGVIGDLSRQLADALTRVRELEHAQSIRTDLNHYAGDTWVNTAQPLTFRNDTTTCIGVGSLVGVAGGAVIGSSLLAQMGGAALKA